jgi:hypothetical protein
MANECENCGVSGIMIAWKTTGKNPCNNPPVHISIASEKPGTDVWPWVLPLDRAREMFGHVVDQIGDEPVKVTLSLVIE